MGRTWQSRSGLDVGAINTTEVCNLECVMCHFNGPRATKKKRLLDPATVRKVLEQIPSGNHLWFSGTGDFTMDPNALDHLRAAVELGHKPCLLSNGQLFDSGTLDQYLEIGVRWFRFSVDAIEPDHYARVRRGGQLQRVLDTCAHLRARKKTYPDLQVEVNNTLFKNTFNRQEEFIEFWRGKVDAVNFNAEYHDVFRFRNLFFDPGEPVDCKIRVYLLPDGRLAPCCAMMVYQQEHQVDWLPHVSEMRLEDAQRYFEDLYADPSSPLRAHCQSCDWWLLWKTDDQGRSPYWRNVPLEQRQDELQKPRRLRAWLKRSRAGLRLKGKSVR